MELNKNELKIIYYFLTDKKESLYGYYGNEWDYIFDTKKHIRYVLLNKIIEKIEKILNEK